MPASTPPLRHALATLALACAFVFPAQAQTCAGFTDVASSDPLCPSVEWIRNRGITQGCGTNLFCPASIVPRREMAAFVARLGQALEPVMLRSADSATPASLDLTGALFSNVICQTPTYAVADYPRRVSFQGFLSGNALANQPVIVDVVVSYDNGATWQLTRDAINGATFPAVGATSVAVFGDLDVNVGQSVRFGIAPTATVSQNSPSLSAYCGVTAQVQSRTGTTSPLDAPAKALVDPAARAARAFLPASVR